MEFRISKHAASQMKMRSIKNQSVSLGINHPDKVIKGKEQTIFHKIIKSENKNYLLRIFVNHLKKPALVITVYKTSKIKKI